MKVTIRNKFLKDLRTLLFESYRLKICHSHIHQTQFMSMYELTVDHQVSVTRLNNNLSKIKFQPKHYSHQPRHVLNNKDYS